MNLPLKMCNSYFVILDVKNPNMSWLDLRLANIIKQPTTYFMNNLVSSPDPSTLNIYIR